jgi:DMSO/TMAO reductase YedYZ molybdopterin-dependent catalytic subunit
MASDHISRGFAGRRRQTGDPARIPPGQYRTRDFPVLSAVTKWSKLDTGWRGVSVDTLLEHVDTAAEYVTAWCDGGYTTNLALDDEPGFWETFGYHNHGDPWLEQRYQGD